jgi:hypothetical protein
MNACAFGKVPETLFAGHAVSMGEEECIYGFGGKSRRKGTTRKTQM